MKKTVDPVTEVAFVPLKGGSLEVGLRAKEKALVEKLTGETAKGWPKPTKATVKPFLVSAAPLSPEVVGPLVSSYETFGLEVAHVSAADAAKVCAELGYRLITEAEWEYIVRSGGGAWASNPGKRAGAGAYKKNKFGVAELGSGTWLAPAKGKKPTLAAAGGVRSQPWQVPGEEITVHAAYREKAQLAPLLVAWDGKVREVAPTKPVETWHGNLHVPTQLTFVDIPGGTFEMGLSAAERARIEKALPAEHHAAFAAVAAKCRPRKATVKPFRVATTPIPHERSQKLGGTTDRIFGFACNPMKTVEKWAKKFGFRLLTEAEWEFLARDGGTRGWGDDLEALLARLSDPDKKAPPYTNRFGVEGLHAGSYVDDGSLVRSTIWRDSGYPNEVGEDIPGIYRRRIDDHGWAPILFAIA
jgi:formylglycine-generating enzyme required for sulfatase activity